MLGSYLSILQESLEKKLDVLGHIEEIGQVQTEILKKETFDMEAFDRTVDEKDAFVTELIKLDEGFESLYDRIKEEFARDKSSYAGQIKHLQKLISEIRMCLSKRKKAVTRLCWKTILPKSAKDWGRFANPPMPLTVITRI